MIRVCIFNDKAYGLDVTSWEDRLSESGLYDNLLTEDLIERVCQGDIVMYFETNTDAEDWCEDNGYEYEFVKDDNN